MANNNEYVSKFQELLKNLFQFEASDLDFGIYRILNYKRDLVGEFINKDLVEKVEKAFSKYKEKISERINEEFEQKKQEIIKTLGKDAITPAGDIAEKFKESPIAKEYLKLKGDREELEKIDDIKSQVYNDLYCFFSRYYEDGDFAPHYRYSIKSHKYAIPYNGEEVKLYWVNYGQYYIKTGELFRDYTFSIFDWNYKGIFRVVEAREELGSNKATKERFFVLDDEEPVQVDDKKIIIRFQYRELTDDEVKQYGVEGRSNISKQEKINEKLYENIIASIEDPVFKNTLQSNYKNDNPLLLYQLNRFTRKNTSDYFIHKNLKKFLTEQLDYFIKSDVLSIDTLEEEKNIYKHITRAKVVKEIGEDIIDFLSQIEDFQKRLWEKKKFVIKTEYVITIDRVPEEFYSEIWNNKEQLKEWRELGFDIPSLASLRGMKSRSNLKLPIDTKYFSQDFKENLLEEISASAPLDDLLDGILIKSENWQALNLLSEKYREKVQTIYIDPPYNTGNDGFLYRDNFQHSTWLSMMGNRLNLAKELMHEKGVMFVSIDDREQENLKNLMKIVFGEEKFLAQIIRDIPDGTNLKTIGGIKTSTEYVISFLKDKEPSVNNLLFKDTTYKDIVQDELDEFIETRLTNRGNPLSQILFPKGTGKQNDDLNLVIKEGDYINSHSREKILVKKGDMIIKNGILQEDVILEAPWRMPNILKDLFSGKEVFDDSGQKYENVFFKNNGIPYMVKLRRKTLIPSYLEVRNKKDELFINLMGYSESPKEATIKPVELIYLLVSFYTSNAGIILDFFAGSGTTAHAVMKLNKEDGGKRKFILVEMADYFDTVIIPRIKKVAYSFDWKDGKPQDTDSLGVFFKYQILEQYEDSLDNIELKENLESQNLFKDEYLLKYFLDFETRESPYLLNLDMLKNPFEYKLKVNLSEVGEPKEMVVDIPETFAYLLGLKVNKIKARRDNGHKYLFMLGEKDSQNCVVVFREYDDKWEEDDFAKDKEFIKQELKDWQPSIVYVNGQCTLTSDFNGIQIDVRSVEDSFKRLTEAAYYGNR
jgi:adenine-specific DNA-methyltransferase